MGCGLDWANGGFAVGLEFCSEAGSQAQTCWFSFIESECVHEQMRRLGFEPGCSAFRWFVQWPKWCLYRECSWIKQPNSRHYAFWVILRVRVRHRLVCLQ